MYSSIGASHWLHALFLGVSNWLHPLFLERGIPLVTYLFPWGYPSGNRLSSLQGYPTGYMLSSSVVFHWLQALLLKGVSWLPSSGDPSSYSSSRGYPTGYWLTSVEGYPTGNMLTSSVYLTGYTLSSSEGYPTGYILSSWEGFSSFMGEVSMHAVGYPLHYWKRCNQWEPLGQ